LGFKGLTVRTFRLCYGSGGRVTCVTDTS